MHDEHEKSGATFADLRGPSKSHQKREALALTALAQQLVELPERQLEQLSLDDELAAAVQTARGISARGARKRELKYLGGLLRRMEVDTVHAALARLQGLHHDEVAVQHRCEAWRARLLAEGDTALSQLLDDYPQADRQALRQLVRQAREEQARQRPPRYARALFRSLRDLLAAEPGPAPPL